MFTKDKFILRLWYLAFKMQPINNSEMWESSDTWEMEENSENEEICSVEQNIEVSACSAT